MVNMILRFLATVAIGIVILVVVARYVLLPLAKFLFHFLKWVLKTLPILILIIIFIPGIIDEGVYVLVLLFLTVFDLIKGDDYSGSYSEHFVLNKKSKIAHSAYDSSADTVAPKHRKDVYATRSEVEDMGYRIKKDS